MKILINKFSTDLIAVSKQSANYVFGKKNNAMKLQIIKNGIEIDKYRDVTISDLKLRDELNIKKDEMNFICVSRFAVQKNHMFLIDIFEEILKTRFDSKLILVGDGETRKEVERYVATKGLQNKVLFLGNRSDIPEILSMMDYLILPSKWEGFGIVFVEAQIAGVHCFTSDCVPKESDLGKITFIPLTFSANEWAQFILNIHENYDYEINREILNEYDIKTTVNCIQKIYMKGSQ